MGEVLDKRITVVAALRTVGVTLNLGDVQVSVRAPTPSGPMGTNADFLRAAAIRTARRALEVALQELTSEEG